MARALGLRSVQSWLNSLQADELEELTHIVKSGLDWPDTPYGAVAVKATSYDDFAPFFDEVVQDGRASIHKSTWSLDGLEQAPPNKRLDLSKFVSPRLRQDGQPVVNTQLGLRRNLKSFPLSAAMTKHDRIAMEHALDQAFNMLRQDPSCRGNVHSLTPNEAWQEVVGEEMNPHLMNPDEHEVLVEAGLMFENSTCNPTFMAAGIASDWPCGRGVYRSDDGRLTIAYGEEDHLRVSLNHDGFCLNAAMDRIETILQVLTSFDLIEFATSTKYGYVTSCPSNLGTGMISCMISAPRLTSDAARLADAKAQVEALGLSMYPAPSVGYETKVEITNLKSRIFVTEGETALSLYLAAKAVFALETAGEQWSSSETEDEGEENGGDDNEEEEEEE